MIMIAASGPSVRTAGGHHRYTFQDLVALKAAKRLLDAGVSLQRLRRSVRALRELLPTVTRPLAELAYRVFARLRYRLFGRLDACRLPTQDERERFLD